MSNLIASYRDSSGTYTMRRYDSWLIGDCAGEVYAWRLERAADLDASPVREDYELTEGFSSCDDRDALPAPHRFRRAVEGAVWINGEAFLLIDSMGRDEAYLLVRADYAEGFSPEDLEEIEESPRGLFGRVDEVSTLPDAAPVVGAYPLDVNDSRTFAAYCIALLSPLS